MSVSIADRLETYLEAEHGLALEASPISQAGGNHAHQAEEGALRDEQVDAFLVAADLLQGDCA